MNSIEESLDSDGDRYSYPEQIDDGINISEGNFIRENISVKETVNNNNGRIGTVWSGKKAENYSKGTGTKKDPYVIETAEQLYKMIVEHCVSDDPAPGAYYELASDIYLNDVSTENWYENNSLNEWLDASSLSEGFGFKGHFNGKNHIVYGLYYKNTDKMGGLIPILAGSSNVKNLNVRNAYMNGKNVGMCYIGGIAGYVQTNAFVSIERCSVRGVVFGEAAGTGGIVGALSSGTLKISSCCFIGTFSGKAKNAGGYIADNWGSAAVNDSYTAGCISFYKSFAVADGVRYATVPQSESPHATTKKINCTVVPLQSLLGENAKKVMPKLDWESVWQTVENDYPMPKASDELNIDGTVGAVWSGRCAENFAGGAGTKEDPFQIETGEQLYKLVSEHIKNGDTPAWYIITEDIKLNDTTDENWYEKEKLKQWYTVAGVDSAFAGHLDGQGHIISGMYIQSSGSNIKGALIPIIDAKATVKNIGLTDSYVAMSLTNGEVYGSGIVAYVKNWTANIAATEKNYPVIENCFVDSSVTLIARTASGIAGGLPSPLKILNCYSAAKIDYSYHGATVIGDTWCNGSIIEHCYGCTYGFDKLADGKADVIASGMTVRGSYIFGSVEGDVVFVGITDMLGETAKKGMPELDYKNVWMTAKNSTPVLRMFYPKITKAATLENRYSTISFVTGVEGLSLEPMTATVGSELTLPIPHRDGYRLEGWYVYPEIQCRYPDNFFPYVDITLYANWVPDYFTQDFESYPCTNRNIGVDYEYYKPGIDGYNILNVHGGRRCIHRIGKASESSRFLIDCDEELIIGAEYRIDFWVLNETDSTVSLSLAYNVNPDISDDNNGIESITAFDSVKSGEWTKCSYSFVAKSKWLAFITAGNISMYFDDIAIIRTSDKINYIQEEQPAYTQERNTPDKNTVSMIEKTEPITGSETETDNSMRQTESTLKSMAEVSETNAKSYVWIFVPAIFAAVALVAVCTALIIIKKK